jgi:hypothetical protein
MHFFSQHLFGNYAFTTNALAAPAAGYAIGIAGGIGGIIGGAAGAPDGYHHRYHILITSVVSAILRGDIDGNNLRIARSPVAYTPSPALYYGGWGSGKGPDSEALRDSLSSYIAAETGFAGQAFNADSYSAFENTRASMRKWGVVGNSIIRKLTISYEMVKTCWKGDTVIDQYSFNGTGKMAFRYTYYIGDCLKRGNPEIKVSEVESKFSSGRPSKIVGLGTDNEENAAFRVGENTPGCTPNSIPEDAIDTYPIQESASGQRLEAR